MPEPRSTCPDCDSQLQSVKLIDATDRSMGGGIAHVELSYAAPHMAASQFTGTIRSAGTVKAKICPECGRIILYGDQGTRGLGLSS